MSRPRLVQIDPRDNVAVATEPLAAGSEVKLDGRTLVVSTDVPAAHKVALAAIEPHAPVVKYGYPIGRATEPIPPGAWVHEHNVATCLEASATYRYEPDRFVRDGTGEVPTFLGFRRADGRVGTRNEIWIINTVGCVNHAAERIAKLAAERLHGRVEGVHAFSHPYGCSQLGDDLRNTQRVLAGLLRHPNAGGVLVLGLGCENNQMQQLLALAGDVDRTRLRFFNTQDVVDEIEAGVDAVAELAALVASDSRESAPVSDLIIGVKCGGSDGFSGITANPLVGRIADRLSSVGGGVILTEVPEMFGAEQLLMNRAADEKVFGTVVGLINDFKEYFVSHGQPVYENPSPGNRTGGLSTLEEKSLGAIQKGGHATVTSVLHYGERAGFKGLSLLESPGNDAVSSTALVASGATLLLFTTGRGTPLGFPVPTLKISSNSEIAAKKPHWIDFDAGRLLEGAALADLTDELFALVLDVVSGRVQTNNERYGYREIAIWKEGVTL
jgi:altronate hydrolase